jgi:hypothetical protein
MAANDRCTHHRYDVGVSLDRISAACTCEGYWPCEMAGHTTFDEPGPPDDEDAWHCSPTCPHPSHIGSPQSKAVR